MKEWLKKYDVVTKALAIVIAVVLWIYVVTVVSPVSELKFRDLTPTFVGDEILFSNNSLSVSNIDELKVDVELSGNRTVLSGIDTDDIKISVDISHIKKPDTYELDYTVTLPGGVDYVGKNPQKLKVKIDRITSKIIPIDVVYDGEIAEGYIAGNLTTVPGSLSITGVAEEIEQISYAEIIIAKKVLNTSIHEQMPYTYYDVNGKKLSPKSVQTESEIVIVNLPILKSKTLPLSIDIVEGGGALAKNVEYKITPTEITIAGEEGTVDELDSIVVGVADLVKYADDTELTFKIELPEEVQNLSGEREATVSLNFSGLETKTVDTNSIEIINIPKGYTIEPLTNSLSVMVRGSKDSLDKVLPQNVRAVVDLSSTVLTPGQHTLTARVSVDGKTNVGAVGEYKVVVKVSK